MAQKNTPGPVGMSCLTCKQRHKKCDLRQPACLKCQEGGLECLGYGHNRRGVVCSARSKASRPRLILPKGQKSKCSPDMLLTGTSLRHKPSIGSAHFEGNLSLDSEASNERTGVLDSSSNLLFPSRASHSAVAIRVQQQDKNAEALAVQDYLRLFTPKDYGEYSTTLSSSHHFSAVLGGLTSSPSDPTMSYLNSGDFEVYFMSHIKRMMDFTYFKPHQVQADQLHAIIVSRIRGSNFRRWVMLLSARISEGIIDGDQSQTNDHTRWIEDIETTIHRKLGECPTPQETEVLHADRIEVSLLKTSMSRNCNMYTILRNAAPIFLQHVYSLPEIWLGSSDPTTIPLMNIIGSKHHALVAFTLFDCTCAMAFGLPQQVDYDTSIGVFPKDFLPHEWAYSTPTEFHILLAEINACRTRALEPTIGKRSSTR
ncbi:Pc22g04960 [Rhizoctonia solani AG-1 IB]|uniref:Pc22g04960 n=1 Tax=Thanatephorus cucumeris (strain AG1-IB / isolate 7/3/14) TaxID=1108050 RepID=A0A0B7F9R9_THACB|nr:Pc22g04960 [Rhizoctonia solani AG-1 IB]